MALGVGFISASKPYNFIDHLKYLEVRLTIGSGLKMANKHINKIKQKNIPKISNGKDILFPTVPPYCNLTPNKTTIK